MNRDVKIAFDRAMTAYRFATGADISKLRLDFYSFGGGYTIVGESAGGGESNPFHIHRMAKPVMIGFLRGMETAFENCKVAA